MVDCVSRLTAPESVGRRRAQLPGSGADPALGPRMVHGALAFWMQTTGAALLAAEPCRLLRVWLLAHDGRSARGLLYLAAAVRSGWREREYRQGTVDTDPRL